jgi:hypothetical protein
MLAADAYRWLAALCPALRVDLLDPGRPAPSAAEGWLSGAQVPLFASALVAAEAARIESAHGLRPRSDVAASRLLHHCLWSVGLLLSGPWYLTGQVPRIHPDEWWIQVSTGDLALRPGGSAPGAEAELRAAAAELLGPLLTAFQSQTRRGRRVLWGMAADDLVSGIWHLGRMLGEEERAVRIAGAVLPGDTPPFPGSAEFRSLLRAGGGGHLTRTRLGCCLYYAIRPEDTCVTCPRLSDTERLRRPVS